MHWLKELKAEVRLKEPLNIHTTLRIGGPADAWAEPQDYSELKELVCNCRRRKISYFVIGRGSNILVSDKGFKGMIISLSAPCFSGIRVEKNRIFCGAGLPLAKLIRQAQKKGWAGWEALAGIPASVGGALIMNAGRGKKTIGNLVRGVTVMDRNGKTHLLKKAQVKFGYRQSNLDKYIVLGAEFALKEKSPEEIRENITAVLKEKRRKQHLNRKNAGCIFKNPTHRLTAGEMIEACGLKGRERGEAEISKKHANFIINRANAASSDIFYLMDLAQRKVQKKFGVLLEPEIRII
ncbi:MAG: UDP-N-acetylmuramate dehydrogenase [Candidatus Omnitrophota bacterium]|nr:MAG: UDP-N-acetylmuramate dehydrogenase [Candidatus Omnitrophota bacterium]